MSLTGLHDGLIRERGKDDFNIWLHGGAISFLKRKFCGWVEGMVSGRTGASAPFLTYCV